ncbi:hypothetical protein N9414_03076 [Nodularia spumigena CCY9414]|nr:hypothetical protein N9414_03076 [Nodularia spumigena CCY9414]
MPNTFEMFDLIFYTFFSEDTPNYLEFVGLFV